MDRRGRGRWLAIVGVLVGVLLLPGGALAETAGAAEGAPNLPEVVAAPAADAPGADAVAPEGDVSPAATGAVVAPSVFAAISLDETSVTLGANGGDLDAAEGVTFRVWPLEGGEAAAVEHRAVQLADGSWRATAFIASPTFDEPGVPYSCRVANAVHRLYNRWEGEHLYTASVDEADGLSRQGWSYEGVAWVEPDAGAATDPEAAPRPVYRLYNPSTGDHLYTADENEYRTLADAGWRQEGAAFSSDPAEGLAVYRLYNPALAVGSHLYTTDANECAELGSRGWVPEGVGWWGAGVNADGTWSAASANRFINEAGPYVVEAHAIPGTTEPGGEGPDGESAGLPTLTETAPRVTRDEVVGQTHFYVTPPKAQAHLEKVDNAQGTWSVVVDGVSSRSGVSRVQIPTWNRDHDQSDLVWYGATPREDGAYEARMDVRNHIFGTRFTSHVYVRAGNGLMTLVRQLPYELTLANFLKREGGPYTYTVSIYNPGPVASVTMPTWTQEGGQDDIVWYDAHDQGNGWWSATIETQRMASSGTCRTEVYADGELRGALEYPIEPWEILPAPYRIMNGRVEGLGSPSAYLLAVDTANCVTGIYRGSRGQWQNLAWWDCAPGTWATPTVKGLFSVGDRGYSFGHGYTCYYWTQFYEDYLFHSIKYYEGTFVPLDPTLGRPASLGCVRLPLDQAKWIYDNIPRGTTVLVY